MIKGDCRGQCPLISKQTMTICMPHTPSTCLVPDSHPLYLPHSGLKPFEPASYQHCTPGTCLVPASHPLYLSCMCLTPLIPASYLPHLVPDLHPLYPLHLSYPLYLLHFLRPPTPLTPLTPLTPFILIHILKDNWIHPVTPFQNQNFQQSDPCK